MMPLRALRNSRGFTLLELLITAALMGIVITAITSLFLEMQRNSRVQEELVEVQQNLRVAMDQLTRDITMAGYLIPLTADPVAAAPEFLCRDLNSDGDCLDAGENFPLTLQSAAVTGQVARIDQEFATPTDPGTENDIRVAMPVMADLFDSKDYVRILRPLDRQQPLNRVFEVAGKDRTVPRITLKGFNESVQIMPGDLIIKVTDPNTDNDFDPNTLPGCDGTNCLQRTAVYSLADDPDSADPNMRLLVRNTGSDQVLAAGITDASFTYLLDDGSEVTAPTAAQLSQIRAIRVTLTAATDATRTGSAQVGGVKTRSLTSVVRLRNRIGS